MQQLMLENALYGFQAVVAHDAVDANGPLHVVEGLKEQRGGQCDLESAGRRRRGAVGDSRREALGQSGRARQAMREVEMERRSACTHQLPGTAAKELFVIQIEE